jgi:hypothetical protein
MTDMPAGFYDRYDATKNYDSHLFRGGKVLQSAEINEVQSNVFARMRGITDAVFHDGDILEGCVVQVDVGTGETTCSNGVVYLRGAMRGIPPGDLDVPITGVHSIGIRLIEVVVSELDDPGLLDPAVGLRNYGQPGAHRLQVDPVWGWDGEADPQGDFFPIYVVDAGVLRPKQAPPQMDSVRQAIAKYDRDSAGGTYIVEGLTVLALPDDAGGNQVYSIREGSARLRGYDMQFPASQRFVIDPEPNLRFVDSEPHLSTTSAAQRIDLDLYPVANITEVKITKEVTDTVVHGSFGGAQDQILNTSVLSIVEVKQGATTYVLGTDYQLTSGKVDWSLPGAEPATGSTYTCKYRYISDVTTDITAVDNKGFTIANAVAGTLVLTSYNQYLPRYDRLCIAEDGSAQLLKGVAAAWNPISPDVPSNLLPLATIYQTWDAARVVTNDGVKVVPMSDLSAISNRLDYILGLVAQQRLESSIHTRETGLIKGIFVDPFLDDSFRDLGVAQSGAVFDGFFTLGIGGTIAAADNRVPDFSGLTPTNLTSSLAWTSSTETIVEQLARTTTQAINPYMAFSDVVVPLVTVQPQLDRWVSQIGFVNTASLRAKLFADLLAFSSNKQQQLARLDQIRSDPEAAGVVAFIRSFPVTLYLNNWRPTEIVNSVTVDGITILPTTWRSHAGDNTAGTYVAYGSPYPAGVLPKVSAPGYVDFEFTLPTNMPLGTKQIVVTGSLGSRAVTTFTGWALTPINLRTITTFTTEALIDPLAQTFTLDTARQIAAIDLWVSNKGATPVEVQIRETSNGFPTRTVLASKTLPQSALVTNGPSRFTFPHPVPLSPGVEYAFVVLCNDADTTINIARLGQRDLETLKYVTSQPYQVGVMLSSSNAVTWTAHQEQDLTFRLVGAAFTQTTRTLNLGNVAVTNATDMAVRATVQNPSSTTNVRFALTMPDATVYNVAVDQVVRLPAAVTGNVGVQAILEGDADNSPILWQDVQLLWGTIAADNAGDAVGTTGTYIHRAMTGGAAVTVKITVEVELPGASSIAAAWKGTADGAWTNITGPTAVLLADGWTELTYTSALFTKPEIQTKLTLTGSAAARPRARDLRVRVV